MKFLCSYLFQPLHSSENSSALQEKHVMKFANQILKIKIWFYIWFFNLNFSISKHVFVALLIPPSVWDANEILMTEKQFPSFIHKFVSILQCVTVINADTEKNVPVIYCILIIKIMNWTAEHISLIQNDFHYPFWFSFYSANNYNYWYFKKMIN